MDQEPLIEYRCDCGKLLFKGLMLVAMVEVKCKRCGAIKIFEKNFSGSIPISFILWVKKDGRIVDVCQTGEFLLSYPRKALLEMSVDNLCPLLRDRMALLPQTTVAAQENPYQIKNNIFFLRDGKQLPVESYLLNGKFPDEYRLVNIYYG